MRSFISNKVRRLIEGKGRWVNQDQIITMTSSLNEHSKVMNDIMQFSNFRTRPSFAAIIIIFYLVSLVHYLLHLHPVQFSDTKIFPKKKIKTNCN